MTDHAGIVQRVVGMPRKSDDLRVFPHELVQLRSEAAASRGVEGAEALVGEDDDGHGGILLGGGADVLAEKVGGGGIVSRAAQGGDADDVHPVHNGIGVQLTQNPAVGILTFLDECRALTAETHHAVTEILVVAHDGTDRRVPGDVIPQNGIERLILGIGAQIGEISCNDDGIGSPHHTVDGVQRGGEFIGGIGGEVGLADVHVAEDGKADGAVVGLGRLGLVLGGCLGGCLGGGFGGGLGAAFGVLGRFHRVSDG